MMKKCSVESKVAKEMYGNYLERTTGEAPERRVGIRDER